jgi:CheY-like chemotaxis protein/nitrogen-specific signal transduction histidine kinase
MTAENEFEKIAAGLEASNAELRATLANMREAHARDQAALLETDRRKDEFLATLAHELRNPLAPIRQAAMISRSPNATVEQKGWSHAVITRQVNHMSILLDDLLDISRITRGTLELRKVRTSLANVIESAVETARPVIDAKRHRLQIELPREPVAMDADPLRLSQVLSNLLTNAAKYTDTEGEIRVIGEVRGNDVVIRVIDNGVGISAQALPDIFQMFSQEKSVRDRSDGGLGIGLALSRGLVALHGGKIDAQSAGLGRGSEFSVQLPTCASDAADNSTAPAAQEESARTRRILVADDNLDAGESLAMLLRLDGHEVELATNGTEAVELFEKIKPDFAILDIGMPGLNGYEVARRIRSSGHRDAILIAVTGWGQDADKARASDAGFNHHFTKPVEPAALSALIGS